MSCLGLDFGCFRRYSNGQRLQVSDADATTANFLPQDADKDELILLIRRSNVPIVKIYGADLSILVNNIEFLKNSLIDLKIRPQEDQDCYVSEEGSPMRSPAPPVQKLADDTKDFANHLQRLSNLKKFELDNGYVYPDKILAKIPTLHNLKTLSLQNCAIQNWDAVLPLTLERADLSFNDLFIVPVALLQLKQLNTLILCKNKISHLPDQISQLEQLQKLDLSENRLSCLPDDILGLKRLTKLYLTDNEITQLPTNIGALTSLTHLKLSRNQLSSLPDSIGDLYRLIMLNVCNNKLVTLPESVCNLEIDDDALLFDGNPLQVPPAEICTQGGEAIKGFFNALNKSPGIKCRRLKLVFVGESFAGKTSLVHALVYKKTGRIDPDKRTVGLDFYKWRPNQQLGNDIEMLLLDCAGQRQYFLTHQFFLSQGAVFILVVDLSKYQMTDCDYRVMISDWMDLVMGHIPGATILLVPTHLDVCQHQGIDVEKRCLNILTRMKAEEEDRVKFLGEQEKFLKATGQVSNDIYQMIRTLKEWRPRFPSIFFDEGRKKLDARSNSISLIPVCAKQNLQGINELQEEILRVANNTVLCPVVNREVPEIWLKLEEQLMILKNDFPIMEVNSLREMMSSKLGGLTEEIFKSALLYLNAIGSIAWFNYIKNVCDWVFLNPEWFIKILDSLFRHDHFEKLIFQQEFQTSCDIFNDKFSHDKDLFLSNGHLSKSLLSCIWLRILEDRGDFRLVHIVEILKHFDIICELPKEASDKVVYFIPWFVADEEPEEVHRGWNSMEEWETRNDIIFKIATSVARLPRVIIQQLLLQVYESSELCIPWQSGFLIILPNFKLLCRLEYSNQSSSLQMHGRCLKGNEKDVWKLILKVGQDFERLIDQWHGIEIIARYSLCPSCFEQKKISPVLFSVKMDQKNSSKDRLPCRRCKAYVDRRLVVPPKEIVDENLKLNSS